MILGVLDVLRTKRVYDEPGEGDGFRVLVDRLWPRGLSKERARIDIWLKDVAPSNELRSWYAHKSEKWQEFKKRYFRELNKRQDFIDLIIRKSRKGKITLLYAARDEKLNNAVALKEYVEDYLKRKS